MKFVHAADLHLDSPFRGIGDAKASLKEQLQAATLGALGRVVDHTIESQSDFLIIAGDIYDSKDRNLRALVSFRREMERLAERDIPVFIVHGNHDPLNGWGSGFQLPPNVITFGGRTDTEPFIPVPTADQFVPSHLATELAALPPAWTKFPPTYRSLPDTTNAYTIP